MNELYQKRGLSARDMEALLSVTRTLAAPFDLITMLTQVANAAKQVLNAERCSVWLHDPVTDKLILEVAHDIGHISIPMGIGIAGACARDRQIINVPDCTADPRFDSGVDKTSGYRTSCMLTLPLIDHKDALVGVMQILNKIGGVFDATDEMLATALAAQCAVALQRVRMTDALIEGEKLRQELEMARVVQMSALPSVMPVMIGYDLFGLSRPAELTGGDTFDLAVLDQGLLIVLGDATGHGIAPALSVTQMQAMLRMAFRMGGSLEKAFTEVNNLLADSLPDDRFITAFIGLLDASTHRIRFLSGGQGPILHFHAAHGNFTHSKPTSFPLGAMRLASLRPTVTMDLLPGDILVLLSDGIYEYHNANNEQFGELRVQNVIRDWHELSAAKLSTAILEAVNRFAAGAAQDDDMTIVLVKREITNDREMIEQHTFARNIGLLPAIFAFTAEVFARQSIHSELLPSVDFILEELFTNMVKYSATSNAEICIRMAKINYGIEVTIIDSDVERFDVAAPSNVDVSLPIEQRVPGGLGIYLIQHLADTIDYQYSPESRESRITFRKTRQNANIQAGLKNAGSKKE